MPSDHGLNFRTARGPSTPALTQHNPGCKCRECYGLAEFMLEHRGHTFGLPATRITVLTHGPPITSLEDACDGSMLCPCRACSAERAERIKQGVREDASDPFRKAA